MVRKHKTSKKGVRPASASVRTIPSGSIRGYCRQVLAVPGRAIEAKPKTSVFFISLLLVLALATRGLTVNPFQAAPVPPTVTISTNQQVYQPGDQVFITVSPSDTAVNADVIWVFLEQPNNVSNYFQMLPPTGGTVNITLAMDAPAGNWTAVAVWNPPTGGTAQTSFTVASLPVPEFSSSAMVTLLALATFARLLDGRKISSSSATRGAPSAVPCLR